MQELINKIEDSLKNQSEETKKELYKKLDIEFLLKFTYFEINAQSFASGLIPLDISQFIYNKLRTYEKTTLAERIIISQLMMELLQKRMQK